MMTFAQISFLHIFLHITCVLFAFWVLKSVRIDKIFVNGEIGKIKLLYFLLAILLGSALSNFIVDMFRLVQEAAVIFNL